MCISSSSLHIFCALMLSVGNSGSYSSGPRQAYFFFSAASIAVVCFFWGSRMLHRTSSSRLLHRLRPPPLPPSPPLHISIFSLLNDAVPSIRGSFRGMTVRAHIWKPNGSDFMMRSVRQKIGFWSNALHTWQLADPLNDAIRSMKHRSPERNR